MLDIQTYFEWGPGIEIELLASDDNVEEHRHNNNNTNPIEKIGIEDTLKMKMEMTHNTQGRNNKIKTTMMISTIVETKFLKMMKVTQIR